MVWKGSGRDGAALVWVAAAMAILVTGCFSAESGEGRNQDVRVVESDEWGTGSAGESDRGGCQWGERFDEGEGRCLQVECAEMRVQTGVTVYDMTALAEVTQPVQDGFDPLVPGDRVRVVTEVEPRRGEGPLQLSILVDEMDIQAGTLRWNGELVSDEALLGSRRVEFELLEGNQNSDALEAILLRFELAGDFDGALLFLDRLLDQPSLLHIVLPQKVHYDLERHGEPTRVLNFLRKSLDSARAIPSNAFRPPTTHQHSPVSRDEIIALAMIRSLEAIAALGYLESVEALLDEKLVPPSQLSRLEPLRLRLALSREDTSTAIALARAIVTESDGILPRQQARVDLARQFIAFGVDDPARAMIEDALAEQSYFHTHEPFLLKIGLLLLEGAQDSILDEIQAYLQRVPNPLETRRIIIDELRRLGLDSQAFLLADEAARIFPTSNSIRQALIAALNDGDHRAARTLTARLIEVDEQPFDTLEALLQPRMIGTEPFLLLPIIEQIRRARPDSLTWVTYQIQLLFRQGDAATARALLVDTLRSRNFDRQVVRLLADALYNDQRDVELARVLATEIPIEVYTPELLIRFAEAEYALRFPDRAARWLQLLDELSPDADLWRSTLADALIQRRLYQPMEEVLAPLADDTPSPHLNYQKSIAELANPDPARAQQGLERLRQANRDGIRILQSHYHAIVATLEGGHLELTHAVMEELIHLAMRDNVFVHLPLHILLRASLSHSRGSEAALRFLEEHRPRLVDGRGATWTRFAGLMASAFERTGDPEGAYGFYRDRIWLSRFSRENDLALPIYLNNLAYTFSTTNQNIDEGRDLILRAIVLSNERNASYIDTLGWILYRTGDLEAAEAEIRRALRAYSGPPHGLRELLSHLQEILTHRAIYDQAAWLDAEIQRLPLNDIEW